MFLPHRKYGLKDAIVKWKLDIIFFQEVNLNGLRLASSLSDVWRDASFLYNSHREGRGSYCILSLGL